jgi:hypothetical protein
MVQPGNAHSWRTGSGVQPEMGVLPFSQPPLTASNSPVCQRHGLLDPQVEKAGPPVWFAN